jgi:hypothetical protein
MGIGNLLPPNQNPKILRRTIIKPIIAILRAPTFLIFQTAQEPPIIPKILKNMAPRIAYRNEPPNIFIEIDGRLKPTA